MIRGAVAKYLFLAIPLGVQWEASLSLSAN